MSISQLQEFFSYEEEEPQHIGDILHLLQEQKIRVEEQLAKMQQDLKHVERKLAYYRDIQAAIEQGIPLPRWDSYRDRIF